VNPVFGAGKALIALIARSRNLLTASTVALLSVAETLTRLVRLGIVHDIREVKGTLMDGMKAHVADVQADVLVKRANAFKTITEAVVQTNQDSPHSGAAADSASRLGEAEANLKRALVTYGLFGGTLSFDPDDAQRLRALLAEPVHGNVTPDSVKLEASLQGSASVSAELTTIQELSVSGSSAASASAVLEVTPKPSDTRPD
jgi:hypothetical protein